MALPDVFNGDLFKLQELTAAIKDIKYTPSRIQQMNLFAPKGIRTTSVMIDFGVDSVNIVPSTERGATPNTVLGDKYSSRPFSVTHLPQRSNVMADEVQEVRLFGTEDSTKGVAMVLNEHLTKHKRNLMLTKENHMFGAIKGQILDADSSVILDIHTEMGTTASEFNMELDDDNVKMQNKVVELKRLIDDKLDGVPYTQIHVLCGKGFFDAFIGHAKVEESWLRFSGSSMLRDDLRRGFTYGGVTFEEYRPGAGVTIRDNEAWAIPLGVSDMFIARYAPADYVETVNQVGIEMYSKAMPMDFDKGVILETQANWLHLNTRPNAVIRLGLNQTEIDAV